MVKLADIIIGVIITAGVFISGAFLIPRLFDDQPGQDEDKDNPVTATNFSMVPQKFTDGEAVGFFWNIIGGSGRFTGILRPGEGGRVTISEAEFALGKLFYVFNVGNLATQDRTAILQITDVETGVSYNENFDYIIDPKDLPPVPTIHKIIITQASNFMVTSQNELVGKVNYTNIGDKVSQAIDAYVSVRNSNGIFKFIGKTRIGNIQPGQFFTLDFRTIRLATFSLGFEWTVEFFAWKADTAVILANKLVVPFTLPVENNP